MAKEPRTLSIVSSPLGERFSYKTNTTSRHRQDNNPRPQGFGAAKQLQSHLLSPVSSPPSARHSQVGWLVFQKEAWCSRRGVCSLSNITHCVASEYHTLYGWRHSSSETPFISRENSHPPFGWGWGKPAGAFKARPLHWGPPAPLDACSVPRVPSFLQQHIVSLCSFSGGLFSSLSADTLRS